MADVNHPVRKRPPAAVAAAAAVATRRRVIKFCDPGKASRVAGAPYQREVKGVDGRCSTVVETWTGKRWHCEHGRRKRECKECGGASICEHGRVRSKCKECGGASICEHGRVRYVCKPCGGASICDHGRVRSKCKECGGTKSRKLDCV